MKRNDIINEIKARLTAAFPEVNHILDGPSRLNKGMVPIIGIFQDEEESEVKKRSDRRNRNLYVRSFMVQIEYTFKQADESLQYSDGNTILERLRLCLETDSDFSGLCIGFEEEKAYIATVYTPMVVPLVRYVFHYVDKVGE